MKPKGNIEKRDEDIKTKEKFAFAIIYTSGCYLLSSLHHLPPQSTSALFLSFYNLYKFFKKRACPEEKTNEGQCFFWGNKHRQRQLLPQQHSFISVSPTSRFPFDTQESFHSHPPTRHFKKARLSQFKSSSRGRRESSHPWRGRTQGHRPCRRHLRGGRRPHRS